MVKTREADFRLLFVYNKAMELIENYFFSYKPYLSILLIVISVIVWTNLKKIVIKHAKKSEKANFSSTAWQLTFNFVKYILGFILVILIMQINGINVSSIAAGVGIVSVVVGFALQDFLNDWVMGLSIVWEGYFSVGDIVRYKECVGEVIQFNFKMTKIKDMNDGSVWVISNRYLSEIVLLGNWFDVDVPGAYEVDLSKIQRAMHEIQEKMNALEEVKNCMYLGAQAFESSSISYRFRIYCSPLARNPLRRDLFRILQEVYEREGLSIPYDQLEIHLIKEREDVHEKGDLA